MNNEYRRDFFYAFFSPTPALLGTYIAGFLALSLFSNLIYSELTSPDSIHQPSNGWAVLSIGILLFVAAFLLWKRHRSLRFVWKEGKEIGKYKALVTTISTPDIISKLLEHHDPELRHIWIITNLNQAPYADVKDRIWPDIIKGLNIQFQVHFIHFESSIPGSQGMYEAVKQAFNEAFHRHGLKSEDVVADITSGTKEMTAGVVLACAVHGWKMSYMRSDYEWDDVQKKNTLIPNSRKIIEFDVSFLHLSPPSAANN